MSEIGDVCIVKTPNLGVFTGFPAFEGGVRGGYIFLTTDFNRLFIIHQTLILTVSTVPGVVILVVHQLKLVVRG